jgi:hypothetical protein
MIERTSCLDDRTEKHRRTSRHDHGEDRDSLEGHRIHPLSRFGLFAASTARSDKLVHRTVTPGQAEILRRAIANYRKAKKLMKAREEETERPMDDETMRL